MREPQVARDSIRIIVDDQYLHKPPTKTSVNFDFPSQRSIPSRLQDLVKMVGSFSTESYSILEL